MVLSAAAAFTSQQRISFSDSSLHFGPSAVNALTRHVTALVGSQEDDGGVQFAGMPFSLHRALGFEEVIKLFIPDRRYFGRKETGSNRVYRYAESGPFYSQLAGQVVDRALCATFHQ